VQFTILDLPDRVTSEFEEHACIRNRLWFGCVPDCHLAPVAQQIPYRPRPRVVEIIFLYQYRWW
jgi:hypothetical protein